MPPACYNLGADGQVCLEQGKHEDPHCIVGDNALFAQKGFQDLDRRTRVEVTLLFRNAETTLPHQTR